MTHKKKTYGHQLGPRTHFLTTPKIDLLLYIGEKCAKKPYFYHFFWKKRSNWKKIKNSWCGHQLRTMTYFSKYHTFDPFWYLGCQMLRTHFLCTFSAKTGQITRYLEKKNLWASTRSHDPFFDNPKIWPTFIYRGEVPAHTFAKLPVGAPITDLKKFDPKKVISVKTHHLAMWPTSLSRPKYFGTSPKLPVHALIHDP